jgi:predicted TPR repeat methyltransferase
MSNTAIADPNLQHLHKAREQIAQGDLKSAALTLNKASSHWPEDPRIFLLASAMAEKAGNPSNALHAMRKAVALSPDWAPGKLELALLLARQNTFPEAIELAEQVAIQEPRNPQVLAGVIDIAHRSGHITMAIAHLRRGLEMVPGDVTLRRMLARDLSSQTEHTEALALWDALLQEQPQDIDNLIGYVQACIAAEQPSRALLATQTLLAGAPDDAVYQYFAAIAQGKTPAQQPDALTAPLFDGMAQGYDQHMVRGLQYQLPKQIAEAIIARHPDKKINVLDLGCGTGLLGVCLGRLDGFLVGVDVSSKMIEQAAKHGLYDRFHTVNLHDALSETPDALYQVIAALDVFIYAGEVTLAIPNAHRILTPGGELVFSCETAQDDSTKPSTNEVGMVLQPNGRYAHQRSHIESVCKKAGFTSVNIEETVIRQENNSPVAGFVVTAYKANTPIA